MGSSTSQKPVSCSSAPRGDITSSPTLLQAEKHITPSMEMAAVPSTYTPAAPSRTSMGLIPPTSPHHGMDSNTIALPHQLYPGALGLHIKTPSYVLHHTPIRDGMVHLTSSKSYGLPRASSRTLGVSSMASMLYVPMVAMLFATLWADIPPPKPPDHKSYAY